MTDTLARFRYEGETLDGELVKGEIEAASALAARNELALQGTRVDKISERKGLQAEITKERVPLLEIMHFCRQMASFVRAGVPVLDALRSIESDATNKRFKGVLGDMIQMIGNGATVGDAAARHASVFPPYFLAILHSSELTGRMDLAFDELHRYIKRDVALTKQVRKALIYPAILLVVAIGVCAIIVIFVIPKFAEFFESFDATLPLPTRMLVAIANFVGSTAGLVTGISILVLVVGTATFIRTPKGRRAFHGFLLKVPMLNKVIVYSSTERFARVLSVLLESGVSLSDALPSVADCSNNVVFKEKLDAAAEQVMQGDGFAEPMARAEIFPQTMVQMIRVGEQTGELSGAARQRGRFYNEELDYSVEKLTEWFEPLVIVFIGVVVGFVALAMVSAMYGIYGQVQV
ncbi:MAG: type II secretion system F family protein [Cypionkella sp.]